MADVFRAQDELLGRPVAVKVFRADLDDSAPQRRDAELRALATLNHPNLVTLYDADIARGAASDAHPYLVMELIEGPTLASRIASADLSAEEVARIGAGLSRALAYVHEQGMIHRDLKPANVLISADGRPRLSDFGIVRLVGAQRLTQVDFMVGTASYLSPEQARGLDVGPPSDVYSLGLVLLEALTGVRSFDGPPAEAAAARLARSPHVPASLPPPWPALLVAMTMMQPSARPSAAQVAEGLETGRFAAASDRTRLTPLPLAAGGAAAVAAAMAGQELGDTALLPQQPRPAAGRSTPPAAAASVASAAGAQQPWPPGAPSGPAARAAAKPSPWPWIVAIMVIAIAVAAAVIYLSNRSTGTPTPGTTTRSTPSPSTSVSSSSTSAAPSSSPTATTPSNTPTSTPTTTAPTSTSVSSSAPVSTPPTGTTATVTSPGGVTSGAGGAAAQGSAGGVPQGSAGGVTSGAGGAAAQGSAGGVVPQGSAGGVVPQGSAGGVPQSSG